MLTVFTHRRRTCWRNAVVAGGLLLACTSCTHPLRMGMGQTLQVRGAAPSARDEQAADSRDPHSDGWYAAAEGRPSVGLQRLTDADEWQTPVMRITHPVTAADPVYAGDSARSPDPVNAAPGKASVRLDDPIADESCFFPSDPRVALPTGPPCAPHGPFGWCEPGPVPIPVAEPEIYPEEYLCDGGDRGIRVYHDDLGRHGLDTEDTVAVFTDDTGCRRIRPSTRTCIYAPQFAAVRSASLPHVNLAVDKLAGAHDRLATSGLRSHLTPDVEQQHDQPIGLDGRKRASGIDVDVTGRAVSRVQATDQHLKLYNLFESRLYLAGGKLDRTETALLAQAAQRAAAWTRDLNPMIIAVDVAGQEVIAEFHVDEFVGVEDRRRKGDLKIVKLVDEPTARPGDIVTFTIRYENIGDRELRRIRIIDNLTPRLELVHDSTHSDRVGEFVVEDNHEGSVVLTFELADPLPGRTGGTLTFQCRVR